MIRISSTNFVTGLTPFIDYKDSTCVQTGDGPWVVDMNIRRVIEVPSRGVVHSDDTGSYCIFLATDPSGARQVVVYDIEAGPTKNRKRHRGLPFTPDNRVIVTPGYQALLLLFDTKAEAEKVALLPYYSLPITVGEWRGVRVHGKLPGKGNLHARVRAFAKTYLPTLKRTDTQQPLGNMWELKHSPFEGIPEYAGPTYTIDQLLTDKAGIRVVIYTYDDKWAAIVERTIPFYELHNVLDLS